MDIKLPVKKIMVLTGRGPDEVALTLDLESPFPEMGYEAEAHIQTRAGYGETWLNKVLGIATGYEIINIGTGKVVRK